MNIFVLHFLPQIAALYHCDKHVVKMILEYAQILCTTHRYYGATDDVLYKKTHVNHPACVWVRKSKSNYDWLYELFCECCKEYTFRYKKIHKTQQRLIERLKEAPMLLKDIDMTTFPQCMPDECKVENNAIEAYRQYYIAEKAYMAVWKFRETPEFMKRA